MNTTQRIRLGLLLTNLKLGGRFSFRTFVNDKDYPKDPDPKNWRTINGSHVHLTNGKVDGGAGGKFEGNEWHGKVAHGHNSFFPPKGWVKPPPPPPEPKKPDPEPVPFGSEAPKTPNPSASGVPVAYINTLKGSFKKLPKSDQEDVKDMIKGWKKDGVSKLELEEISYPEHHATITKTIEALKAKQITPTAAQNVIAAAMYYPGHVGLKKLSEEWGGGAPASAPPAPTPAPASAPDDPFATQVVHLPKSKVPQKTGQEIYDEISAKNKTEAVEHLKNQGVAADKAEEIYQLMEKAKKADSNYSFMEAIKYEKAAIWEIEAAGIAKQSNLKATYNDLNKSEKDQVDMVKNAVAFNNMTPEEMGKYYLNNPKKEFAEMAWALTDNYIANPTPEAQKDLHDKLAQIMKGQYKASKEDIATWKEWKNPGQAEKKKYEEAAEKILKEIDADPYTAQEMLYKKGFSDAEAEAIVDSYFDKPEAETVNKIIEGMKKNGLLGAAKSPSAIAQTLATEGPKAKAAGLMQTPGASSVDTSEKATGIKQAPGTLSLFAKKGSHPADPAFNNFADYQEGLFKKLKPSEKKGILRYTQGSTHLRDWLVYGREDPYFHDDAYKHPEYVKNGMTGKAMQKVADDISAGLKKMKHPSMWVSRAGSLMDWATKDNPKGLTLADLKKMAKSGEVFENKAFLSSSPLEKPTFSLSGTSAVCRYIYTPEEASGGYIDSGSHYSSKKGNTEYEFLLDKKTKTRIMKVEEKNGVIYTYEEVVV